MIADGYIYRGDVVHKRLRPTPHALRYQVFSLLLNVDSLSVLDRKNRLFGYNRHRFFSIHDRDFGARDGTPIATHARELLAQAGFEGTEAWSIALLAYPRVLGYAFNPLSVYYCYDRDRTLRVMIYEVTNTFGERRSYVVSAGSAINGTLAHACTKDMYVSPFASVTGKYGFRVAQSGSSLTLGVLFSDPDGPLIKTHFRGTREVLSDSRLALRALTHPLMTFKVMAGIHVEALRLWLKKVPIVRRPAGPSYRVQATPLEGEG